MVPGLKNAVEKLTKETAEAKKYLDSCNVLLFHKMLQRIYNGVKQLVRDKEGFYTMPYSDQDIPAEQSLRFGQNDKRGIFIRAKRDEAYSLTSGLALDLGALIENNPVCNVTYHDIMAVVETIKASLDALVEEQGQMFGNNDNVSERSRGGRVFPVSRRVNPVNISRNLRTSVDSGCPCYDFSKISRSTNILKYTASEDVHSNDSLQEDRAFVETEVTEERTPMLTEHQKT